MLVIGVGGYVFNLVQYGCFLVSLICRSDSIVFTHSGYLANGVTYACRLMFQLLEKSGCDDCITDFIPLLYNEAIEEQARKLGLTIENHKRLKRRINFAYESALLMAKNILGTCALMFGSIAGYAMYEVNFDPLTSLLYTIRYFWFLYFVTCAMNVPLSFMIWYNGVYYLRLRYRQVSDFIAMQKTKSCVLNAVFLQPDQIRSIVDEYHRVTQKLYRYDFISRWIGLVAVFTYAPIIAGFIIMVRRESRNREFVK